MDMRDDMGKELLITKVLNKTFIREICHQNDVKISAESVEEISIQVYSILKQTIIDIKKANRKVIVRQDLVGKF